MPKIARLAVLEKYLPAGQEYCLVLRTGFVNLLKVVLVLMAQKVVLQIQLQKMIPSFAMPDLFLWDLFELLSRHRTESSLVVRGQSVAVRLQEDLSAVLYDALILIDVPSSMAPHNMWKSDNSSDTIEVGNTVPDRFCQMNYFLWECHASPELKL